MPTEHGAGGLLRWIRFAQAPEYDGAKRVIPAVDPALRFTRTSLLIEAGVVLLESRISATSFREFFAICRTNTPINESELNRRRRNSEFSPDGAFRLELRSQGWNFDREPPPVAPTVYL